jgi:TatD DNase family protein
MKLLKYWKEKTSETERIFHCFSGNLEQAKHAIDLNFILGIGGVVTFKNGKIDQFLNEIPLIKLFWKQILLI